MKKHWGWLIGLLCIELTVAVLTPPTILTDSQLLRKLVDLAGLIAPTIQNFHQVGPFSESIQFYLAVTILFLPLKVTFCYLWLNSDQSFFRTLVISPLTIKRPHNSDYIFSRVQEEQSSDKTKLPNRSMLSRIVWSIFSLLLCAATFWYVFISYGSRLAQGKESALATERLRLHAIVDGGVSMWMSWSLEVLMASTVMAVAICICEDYFIFAVMYLRRLGRQS